MAEVPGQSAGAFYADLVHCHLQIWLLENESTGFNAPFPSTLRQDSGFRFESLLTPETLSNLDSSTKGFISR
jgi:hypothetical protein